MEMEGGWGGEKGEKRDVGMCVSQPTRLVEGVQLHQPPPPVANYHWKRIAPHTLPAPHTLLRTPCPTHPAPPPHPPTP